MIQHMLQIASWQAALGSRSPDVDGLLGWIARLWSQFVDWAGARYSHITEWLSQPYVIAIVTAFWITFALVCLLLLFLGFGPAGIVAGSAAAAFQSFMYGAFTPAGGIFATLTSMAMLGTLAFPICLTATVIATIVAILVWNAGVGR